MNAEMKSFIAAYAKSLDITQAEAEEKILHTGAVRINALRKYANAQKKLAGPKVKKAPKAKAAPKGTSIAKKKATKAPKAKRAPKATPAAAAPAKVSAMDEGGIDS